MRRARFVAGEVLDDLARWGITHCSLVPAMLAALVELGPPPASLRVALVGGQGLNPALAQRAIAAGWPIQVSYGMTETASAVAVSARLARAPAEGGSVRPSRGSRSTVRIARAGRVHSPCAALR